MSIDKYKAQARAEVEIRELATQVAKIAREGNTPDYSLFDARITTSERDLFVRIYVGPPPPYDKGE